MKPFSIICKSCAVRLKVTKPSTVGQLLACPKCGTMIKIVPPKGWVNPNPKPTTPKKPAPKKKPALKESKSAKPKLNPTPPNALGANKASDSQFDFDDIDQLLAKPDEVKSAALAGAKKPRTPADARSSEPKKSKPKKRPAVGTVSPRTQKRSRVPAPSKPGDPGPVNPGQSATPDTQPMLPNNQWETDESKRQKRLVLILGSILVALLLSGFFLAVFNSNREKPPMPVTEKKKPDNKTEIDTSDADPESAESETTSNSKQDPDLREVVDPNELDPTDPETSPDPGSETATSDNQTPSAELPSTPTQPPTVPTSEQANQDPLGQPPLLPSPFRTQTQSPTDVTPEPSAKKQAGVGMIAKMENQIGDLAGLLEESGASLGDLRDVAFEASGPPIGGIPKYVIEKPGPMNTDLERLKLNVGGMLFDQTPLPVVVRDLISISGIPITIDARAIEAAGIDVNQSISLTIQDAELDTAINRIIVPLGITKQPDSAGLKFTVTHSLELKSNSYSLVEIARLNEQAKNNFLAYIQAMIDPQIWVRTDNPATVELQGNDIVANCPGDTHARIKQLFAKLKSANTLVADPTDEAAIAKTLTRSDAIASKLDAPLETKQTIRTPIGAFLTNLQSQSGVTVLVDWENVAKEGWTPQTLIPGSIDEPTTGDLVKQLAQSMNLSVVAIDHNTLMLTTIDQASIARDIEIYPVANLLAGKFDEAHLKEAFETTLGFQLRTEKYVYDASCQCFIVAASQSKQRQVEALLKRLQGI